MDPEIAIAGVIFSTFLIPMIVEVIVFAKLNEWCTKIGLRTARLHGKLPKQGQVDLDALQDLGFYVRPLSERRILLRPFTSNENREREGALVYNPKGSMVEHVAVLTLGKTHWTLEIRMMWVIWAFLLAMFGHLALISTPRILMPGGTLGILGIGLFLVMATLTISSYRDAHKDYRKVVEFLEWDA